MIRLWLLLLFPLGLSAQPPKLKSGLNAFKNGDYINAISQFDGVISNVSKPEERAEAHFYRAESYIKLYHFAVQQNHQPLLQNYFDVYVRACEDYKRSIELDRNTWEDASSKALSAIYPELVHDGLQKLEKAKKEKDIRANTQLLSMAALVLHTAAEVQPQQYLPRDLLGQIAMEQGQYRQAEGYLRESVALFHQYPPETPDLLAAYAYYRLALLHRYYLHPAEHLPPLSEIKEALEYLRQARSTLDTEYRRAARMAGKLKSQELEKFQRQYQSVLQDFYYLELDLYLHLPELHQEALARFREALRKDPENYTLTLAYAQLLEQSEPQQALSMYQKAAMLQPDSYEAHYHIGIIFVNEAARLEKEAKLTPNLDRYQQLNALSREFLAKARPHLQIAYRSRPDNLEVVNALLQVSLNLHMPEDYQQYKRKQMELNGNN